MDFAYSGGAKEMNDRAQQIRFAEYRLMVISSWPEGDWKAAALAAARAALEREMAVAPSQRRGWAAVHPGAPR